MVPSPDPPSRPNGRPNGRKDDELRLIRLARRYTTIVPGSVLVEFGGTRVFCTASVEESVPSWLRGGGRGWVTAEYSMLPAATQERKRRERNGAGGRTKEIERLIGRSLRGVTDLEAMGELQVTVDCDVLQADGGTRTASITGGWVALHDAFEARVAAGSLAANPIRTTCAAVSVGIVGGRPLLDLEYVEDVKADVDMNVVMTGDGEFVEVQGTAEGATFSRKDFGVLLDLAEKGCRELFDHQQAALAAG
ncbi:MAG: ribonuclease PH [Acidimicrobiia bacterium]|nr:ribonuclease PH [Acidimicrobiia bacterium]